MVEFDHDSDAYHWIIWNQEYSSLWLIRATSEPASSKVAPKRSNIAKPIRRGDKQTYVYLYRLGLFSLNDNVLEQQLNIAHLSYINYICNHLSYINYIYNHLSYINLQPSLLH